MIPKQMESFLRERLPASAWNNRLIRDGGRRFMEFGPLDVDRLARLDIEVDSLGPRLVVCMWDEDSSLEIGGYLVVDNMAMGRPSMGGIRMLPDIAPASIHNLARGMTLKNAAADLPYGGGKAGIVAERGLTKQQHTETVRAFAHLIRRYTDIYLPGPDVGTNDEDMKTIAIENGLDNALSKTVEMGGNCIDELGAAAGGLVIALAALLEEMPRLRVLPQFSNLEIPDNKNLTILIQGFGAVGAHTARILDEQLPKSRVIGISDWLGYLFHPTGLPIRSLFRLWKTHGLVTRPHFKLLLRSANGDQIPIKFSTHPDDLLRESAFCLIPAAPIANYLDTDPASEPCMTVDHMGNWSVIIEGANTYSPDPVRKSARARMERAVYRERGVLIASDYLVNSGGVIFAAQEHLIKTPPHLRVPDSLLSKHQAVEHWLEENARELSNLAKKRLEAAREYREEVIRRNMHELVDLLISDADMLPAEAAELISIRRIASSESDRTAEEILEPIPTISEKSTIQEAAAMLVDTGCPILSVITLNGDLAGVVTEWDITRATANDLPNSAPLHQIMSKNVVAVSPNDLILEVVRKLEHHEFSAMPVVRDGRVIGMVSSDLLARRSLLKLLQSQIK